MFDTVTVLAPKPTPRPVRYSIGTLVTDHALYTEMLASFRAGGFMGEDCEYFAIDNTGASQTSAFHGLNRVLNEANGDFVILVHQDVCLLNDHRAELDLRLAELDRRDPAWGVAGNAGGAGPGRLALRITDGHAANQKVGDLPARVSALDENLLIVRRSARIGFSANLDGFHFYGADLCLAAETLGHSAYVIDFHVHHLSKGNKSPAFYQSERAFRAKWARAFRPRWIQTTCALVYLSGERMTHAVGGVSQRLATKIARRLPGARGFPAKPRAEA